ncbi:Zinc finger, CCHC-type [Parasponia andersonii]|uniref:Zinc finger, CCHC-type n=1 Tax=Parasponia andersonii TaxID=3476 RepID=A0A2P5CHZ1_PARAD|nr:Zinc finger, CCHC-type [Parasponia andersonii]
MSLKIEKSSVPAVRRAPELVSPRNPMGRREKQRGKLDREVAEEDDRIGRSDKASKSAMVGSIGSDGDDEEANEDLCMKIVERAKLMRAAKLVPDPDLDLDLDGFDIAAAAQPRDNASQKKNKVTKKLKKRKEIANENRIRLMFTNPWTAKGMRIRKVFAVSSSFVRVFVYLEHIFWGILDTVVATKEEDKPESMAVVVAEATEPDPVAISDNIVFRKLLRGPRYFDPPDSSWGKCYNCGEEGHAAVNCKSPMRRRPCYLCGSFEHNSRQCTKKQICFICEKGGHVAKDCPDKTNGSSVRSKICLKCGNSGHDMFSCRNDYQHDDLKEICCYVCKSFGHLCCVKYVDSCPKEVSCYRCGQLGHTGLSCTRDTKGSYVASLCYRCKEEGHFARECTSTLKLGKRNREPLTPTNHKKESKSAPHYLVKDNKKKKNQYEVSHRTTPQKSKHKGGWIMEDPGDFVETYNRRQKKSWLSPATPYSQGHRISTLTAGGHLSTSQSSKRSRKYNGNPNFQRPSSRW